MAKKDAGWLLWVEAFACAFLVSGRIRQMTTAPVRRAQSVQQLPSTSTRPADLDSRAPRKEFDWHSAPLYVTVLLDPVSILPP